MTSEPFNLDKVKKTLKSDARAIGIPSGAADSFINQTLKNVQKTLKNKTIITDRDLDRAIVKELKKYHKDFAYVYQNRDKII